MERCKKWGPAILWAGVIFYLSSQTSPPPTGNLFFDAILPYLAHLVEYGLLFILIWRANKTTIIAFLIAFVYALSDEWHQSFVPTRNPSLVDVFVDVLGMIFAWMGIWYAKLRRVPIPLLTKVGICGMETITKSAAETQKLGEQFAQRLKGGEIIGLIGELGSGKTTFVQGLARGLGIKKRIISPTFIFIRPYTLSPEKGRGPLGALRPKPYILFHVDLYRIENSEGVKGLGLEEIWSEPGNIVLIEWAEKIEKLLPKKTIKIYFNYQEKDKRRIKVSSI